MLAKISFVFYSGCLLLLGGMTNMLLTLFLMELLSWALVLMMEKSLALKYLILQSVFLFMGLFGVFMSSSILILALLVKMGLPPFHFWMMVLLSYLKKSLFFIMLTLHKLLPILVLSKILSVFYSIPLQLLLLASGLAILQSSGVTFVVLASSLIHSGWLLLSNLLSFSLTLFYWVSYSLLFFLFLMPFKTKFMKMTDLNQTSYSSMMWLFMSGLPPFTMFWLKLSIFFSLSSLNSFSFLVIVISVMSIASYYRAYHLSIHTSNFHNPLVAQICYFAALVGIF